MRNIRNFKTISGGIAAITLLAAATIIVAEGDESKKSTYERKIEEIMVKYVKEIQRIENSYGEKMAIIIKGARTVRNDAIAKSGKVLKAKFDRAAKDAKRLGRTDDAKMAEEKIAMFTQLIERAQATDPDRPEVKKGSVTVKAPPLASHVSLGGHAYLAIMGDVTLPQAMAACRRIGGRLVSIESDRELLFLQKELPVKHTLWVGAVDARYRGQWRWLTGGAVKASCWASGQPREPFHDLVKQIWTNVYAALSSKGLSSRHQKTTCKGFICEWGR